MTVAVEDIDWEKCGGLIPAVVQDRATRDVLMLGYMNPEALRASLETGFVTFYSRSKQRLWKKGETSGHTLRLASMTLDCDRDTLLVAADPAGPVCHLGTATCFGDPAPDARILDALSRTIDARRGADPARSYTARLLSEGTLRAAQKVGEEAVETAIAAAVQGPERLASESADLLYHLLVLWAAAGVTPGQVWGELRRRAGAGRAEPKES